MKIVSLHIENFGKFSNFDISFADKINQFVYENGWGKSTLCAFIKVMLYGMDAKGRKKDFQSERSKFEPWQGGNYGGSLTFKVNEKEYQIFRFFGKSPEEDKFQLLDLETNAISKKFSQNLGEELLGIGKDSFSISAFFAQSGIDNFITDEVVSNLAGIERYKNDVEKTEQAINILEKKRKETVSHLIKPHQIKSIEKNIESLEEDIGGKENKAKILLSQFEETMAVKDEFMKKFAETEKQLEKNYKIAKERQQVQNLLNEKTLQLHEKLDSQSRPKFSTLMFISIVCGIFGLIFVFLAAFAILSLSVALPLAVVLLLTGLGCFVFDRKKQTKSADILQLENQLGQLKSQLQEMPEFTNIDSGELYQEKNRFDQEVLMRQFAYNNLLSEIEKEKEELGLLQSNHQQMLDQNKTGEDKIAILKQAMDFLKTARENVSQRFVAPLNQKFVQLFKPFAKEDVKIDHQFNALVFTRQGLKSSEFLSKGYQDLIAICQRFSMLDNIYKQEKPPIILDDTFVNIDDNKFKLVSEILKILSQNYQVLYFTCSESRKIEEKT